MKDERKYSREAIHIGSILKKAITNCRRDSDKELTAIWGLWNTAVGKAIAENAQPEAFKGKILLVNVSNSIWFHQLQFLKKEIITKINDAMGNELVEEIKFKIGPI
jgi:predicted nucleic acid-binding Zn ribbon protein